MKKTRVAICQINVTVGDFDNNVHKICEYINLAAQYNADIVVFPELCICGYPPEDLLLKHDFLEATNNALTEIAEYSSEFQLVTIIGYAEHFEGKIYNSAAIIHHGQIYEPYRKTYLPNYGVFDEKRYFSAGEQVIVYATTDFTFGVGICEDIWHPEGPLFSMCANGGCEIYFNINASPFALKKQNIRENMIFTRAYDNIIPIVYVNLCGGQDELVFDGHSFVCASSGDIVFRCRGFEEQFACIDISLDETRRARLMENRRNDMLQMNIAKNCKRVSIPFTLNAKCPFELPETAQLHDELKDIWSALVLGLRDYAHKNGFKSAILGLSGGIDSALVAAICTEALGAENVAAVYMPTRYSQTRSFVDAKLLADNLGISFTVIEIDSIYNKYLVALSPHFANRAPDTTEENIQARVRGTVLMAFSNKFNHLLVATGNKSEMSAGYATLYGDMAGGFAILKDVYKTTVWDLSRFFNAEHGEDIIPQTIIDRPPTAELRENQLDSDNLPEYAILDKILKLHIENELSAREIFEQTGIELSIIKHVIHLVKIAEYKRRQSAPGIKITSRAFGKDRRMPITVKY